MDERFLADVLPHELLLDASAGILLLSTPRRWRAALALGCAWAVTPVNVEVADDAVCLDLSRQHEALIQGLPIGTALQVLWTMRPCTEVPAWEQLRASLPDAIPCRPLLASQAAAIRTGLPHQTGTTMQSLRAPTTLVTFRMPVPQLSLGLGGLLRTCLNTPARAARQMVGLVQEHLAQQMQRLLQVAAGLEATLRAAGHGVERLTGQGIGTALARALAPLAEDLPVLDLTMPLRHQTRALDCQRPSPDRWLFPYEDVPLATQVLSLHQAPTQTFPGMLSSSRTPEGVEPLALWDAWPGPLTIACNVAASSPETEKARLHWRLGVATMQAALSVENRKLKEQLEGLLGSMFVAGGGIAWGRVHLVAWGAPERVQTETPTLIRACRRLGLEFAQEPLLGSDLFLHTLPLGFDPDYPAERHLQRGRRLTRQNLADLLPLYGHFDGTRTASVLYLNRQGKGIGFSPFDMLTNRHMIFKGGSGAGKSFNFGYFLNHILPLGGKACIIDDLPSYADLAAAWGRNLVMEYNTPFCFNPFYGPLDDDHQSHAQEILAYMASGGRDDQRLDQEHTGVLSQAIGAFADARRGGPEATLSDFYQTHLLEAPWAMDRHTRGMARSIARRLGKFVGNGACAGFVDGPNTFALHPTLTVLQLSQLRDEDLKGVIVLALMHLLTVEYASPATWGIPKFFGSDENWALLDTPSIARLLLKVAVTYRKLGVSACFISPHARHFSGPVGSVLKDIASIKLFLAHEASEIEETAEVFQWSAAEKALFTRGAVARHAAWSSAYLSFGDKKGGVVRIVPDALVRWQLTQDDQERALRADAIAKANGNVWAALAQLAVQYPQGVHRD